MGRGLFDGVGVAEPSSVRSEASRDAHQSIPRRGLSRYRPRLVVRRVGFGAELSPEGRGEPRCPPSTPSGSEPEAGRSKGRGALGFGAELSPEGRSEPRCPLSTPRRGQPGGWPRIGGESGIRTHGGLAPTHDFQSCRFSHSRISPLTNVRDCISARSPSDGGLGFDAEPSPADKSVEDWRTLEFGAEPNPKGEASRDAHARRQSKAAGGWPKIGGEGGIRTHGAREGSTVFETARFNRSRTSPKAEREFYVTRRGRPKTAG